MHYVYRRRGREYRTLFLLVTLFVVDADIDIGETYLNTLTRVTSRKKEAIELESRLNQAAMGTGY